MSPPLKAMYSKAAARSAKAGQSVAADQAKRKADADDREVAAAIAKNKELDALDAHKRREAAKTAAKTMNVLATQMAERESAKQQRASEMRSFYLQVCISIHWALYNLYLGFCVFQVKWSYTCGC